MPNSLRTWLCLPSRLALLLGAGALSGTGAQAAAPTDHGKIGLAAMPEPTSGSGDMLVWSEGGRIYLSEPGKQTQELRLGDTAEARSLKRMLEAEDASAASPRVMPRRMLLAGTGGQGFHWARPGAATTPPPSGRKAATPPKNAPQQSRTPRDTTGSNGTNKD
jgi:hypothetical protein